MARECRTSPGRRAAGHPPPSRPGARHIDDRSSQLAPRRSDAAPHHRPADATARGLRRSRGIRRRSYHRRGGRVRQDRPHPRRRRRTRLPRRATYTGIHRAGRRQLRAERGLARTPGGKVSTTMPRRFALALSLAFTTIVTFSLVALGVNAGFFSDAKKAATTQKTQAAAQPPAGRRRGRAPVPRRRRQSDRAGRSSSGLAAFGPTGASRSTSTCTKRPCLAPLAVPGLRRKRPARQRRPRHPKPSRSEDESDDDGEDFEDDKQPAASPHRSEGSNIRRADIHTEARAIGDRSRPRSQRLRPRLRSRPHRRRRQLAAMSSNRASRQ